MARRPPRRSLCCFLFLVHAACAGSSTSDSSDSNISGIRAYAENPHYLAWDGVPIFPLGATGPHAWTPISRPDVDFERQLDRLAGVIDAVGSPHVRGLVRVLPYDPMNHMHDGAVERVLQPWRRTADGRYDLERFDPAWESRLRAYLEAALRRRIVVSLELWDDWSITRGPGGQYDPGEGAAWNAHPFNPRNNVNIAEEALGAVTAVCEAPFYGTVRARGKVEDVLRLQRRYAERLLEIAAPFPNVLLNLSNESRAHLDWSRYWATEARTLAPDVRIGEMPSTNRRDGGGECDERLNALTLATDPRYDFVDISQAVSRHEFAEVRDQAFGGARRIHAYRQAMALAGTRRPLLVSKEYTRGPDGGDLVLWSRFVGGAASARFHRPGADHDPELISFQHEAIGRLGRFLAGVPFWRMHPAPELVESLPAGAEINVLAEPNGQVVIQLLGGAAGEFVTMNLAAGAWIASWVDPASGRELERARVVGVGAPIALELPSGPAHRVVQMVPDPAHR